MTVFLDPGFAQDLREAMKYYADFSETRADDLDAQVRKVIRTIARRKGGDHVGPHGYPCRRCSKYPYYVIYRIVGATLYIVGLVHTGRHPDFLRRRLEE